MLPFPKNAPLNVPQMCPQMSPDYGTLLWTLAHFELKTTEVKKKKAGRLCTFAALKLSTRQEANPLQQLFCRNPHCFPCELFRRSSQNSGFCTSHVPCDVPQLGEKWVFDRRHSAVDSTGRCNSCLCHEFDETMLVSQRFVLNAISPAHRPLGLQSQ